MNEVISETVSIREVYQLVDHKVGEVNASIQRLENKFDNLEAGRLSSLEAKVADLQGRMLVTGGIIAFVTSVLAVFIQFLLKK